MRKTLILALVICFMTAFGAQAAQINKVAAVVNGQVITILAGHLGVDTHFYHFGQRYCAGW